MNKKIVFRNQNGEIFHCILSADENFDDQLNRLIYGDVNPGHGICVRFSGDTIDFVDYYHAERMAYHQVIRIEDTDEAVSETFVDR